VSRTEREAKLFTPEALAKALDFPEGSRVVGFRCVDWKSQWQIVADFSDSGIIPQSPKECGDLTSYVQAYRAYVRQFLDAASNGGGEGPMPDRPIYQPSDVIYLATELERALKREREVDQ
jgi:hypothetical protein